MRLQKRNIEINVYRLSLSCLYPNPFKFKPEVKKRDLLRWAIFHRANFAGFHIIKAISFTHLKEEREYLEIWRKEKFSSV